MITTVVGNYPKIPLAQKGINLRQAMSEHEKGKIDDDRLEDVYRKTILRTIEDQQTAGVDIITDGQIRWTDLTSPMTRSLQNVLPGGLRRFFDNNSYYRRPQITGLISRHRDLAASEYRFAADNGDGPVKAVLCGPITFCHLSDNYYYRSFDKLAEAIAGILAEEASALIGEGCRHIQLDEPALPLYPRKMALASTLYGRIFEGIKEEFGIFIYFSSIKPIAESLFGLPVKFIGLDLVSHPDDIKLLRRFDPDKKLVAGLFDGRNIMLENEKTIRARLDEIGTMVPFEQTLLSPSCGLECLPHKYAVAKLQRMGEVARKVSTVNSR